MVWGHGGASPSSFGHYPRETPAWSLNGGHLAAEGCGGRRVFQAEETVSWGKCEMRAGHRLVGHRKGAGGGQGWWAVGEGDGLERPPGLGAES